MILVHGGSPCHQTKTGTGKRKEMRGREGGMGGGVWYRYSAKVHNFTELCGRCKMEGGRDGWLSVGEQESGKARGWVNTEL